MKYAEKKILCECIDVYKIYKRDNLNEIFDVLSTLEKKEIKNELAEKLKKDVS